MYGDLLGTDQVVDGLCEVEARQLESGLVCQQPPSNPVTSNPLA